MMREQTETGKQSGSIKPGTRLNDIYEVTALLAVGGMSEVYKGHNIQTLDEVAIKVILPHLASDEQVVSLFKQEASILNSLGHDAIVRYHVFSVDRLSNTAYLTMELVEGPSLYERIRDRPLSLAEAAKLISRITSGLKVAHERGVIHRDISCDNIILSGGNVEGAKLIDFGIARLGIGGDRTLLAGSFAGKYNYVSPEQLGLFGGDVHEPSDIYSLGLVFAAALRGTPIDMSGTHADVVRKRQSVPELSTIHPAARSIIQRMLQPSPALRPKKDEIIDALRPMIPATKDSGSRRSHGTASLRDARGQMSSGQSSAAKGGSGKWIALACLLLILGGAGWYGYNHQEQIKGYLTAQKASKPTTASGKSEFKLDAAENTPKPQPEQPKPVKQPEVTPSAETPKPTTGTATETKPDTNLAGGEKPDTALPDTGAKPDVLASGEQQKHDEPPPVTGGSVLPQAPITETEWIKQFAGGPCFFAHGVIPAPRTINIEGFAQGVGPFIDMERAFMGKFSYEPTINVRQISAAQCDALVFLRALPVNTGKAAFALKIEVLGPADSLLANLAGIERSNVQVLLVRADGTVEIISSAERRGDSLAINLKLAPPRKGTSVPYILIAIQSDEKLDVTGGKDTFKGLAEKLQKQPGTAVVTVKYFRQQG
jgi:serine/threonine protein kinase